MELVALGLPLGDEPFDASSFATPKRDADKCAGKKINFCDPNGSRKQSRPWKHLAPDTSSTLLAARRVNAVHAILLDCCRNVDPGPQTALFQPSHFSRKRLDLVSTDFRLLLISPFVTKGTECERSTFALSFKRSAP